MIAVDYECILCAGGPVDAHGLSCPERTRTLAWEPIKGKGKGMDWLRCAQGVDSISLSETPSGWLIGANVTTPAYVSSQSSFRADRPTDAECVEWLERTRRAAEMLR